MGLKESKSTQQFVVILLFTGQVKTAKRTNVEYEQQQYSMVIFRNYACDSV